MWFNLSAARGYQDAAKSRDLIAQRMTPAQIAEAQKLAREWRPEIANASSPQAAPQPPAPEKPESGAISGTAFFVSKEGTALTNSHVVERCRQIRVQSGVRHGTARVVGRDDENDLALLATDLQPESAANWRLSIRQGEDIIVVGFPLASVLAAGGNVAVGNVSALAGLGTIVGSCKSPHPFNRETVAVRCWTRMAMWLAWSLRS
jgi:S1-C subfamily serine protease